MNTLKQIIIHFLLFFIRERWSQNNNLKVLLYVNNYFSEKSWRKTIAENYSDKTGSWELVFCRKKLSLLKNFKKADTCFIFGYSNFYGCYSDHYKYLYFPNLGLEFLNNFKLPQNFETNNPPPFSSEAIAEYCLAMAINISRNFQYLFFDQKNKIWNQQSVLSDCYTPLSEKIIGVLGVGKVGARIANEFKNNNCIVLGCDKIFRSDILSIDKWYSPGEIQEFLRRIDILIVALPLNDETKGLIGPGELDCLRENSYLINISRGDIISEDYLYKKLKGKKIKGAILDTFEKEPLSHRSDLYKLNNIIITPHISGNINLFVNDIQKDFIIKVLNKFK